MESSDAWGKGLVKKETRWLTNSQHIAMILSGVCTNVEGKTWHRHVNLINGRARSAQAYPPLLVRGILEALRNQLAEDGEFSQALNSLGAGPVPDAVPVIDEEQEVYDNLPPADLPVAGPVYDSNTGAGLDLAKVAAARLGAEAMHLQEGACRTGTCCWESSHHNEMGRWQQVRPGKTKLPNGFFICKPLTTGLQRVCNPLKLE